MTDHLESQLRATLAKAAADTAIPPMPTLDGRDCAPRRQTTRRRLVAVAAGTCLVLGGGAVAAAASGVFSDPKPVGHDAFGYPIYPGQHKNDPPVPYAGDKVSDGYAVPGTARRILSVPGPQDTTLYLDKARSSDGGYCVRQTDNADQFGSGETCVSKSGPFGRVDLASGSGGQSAATGYGTYIFVAHVPGAAAVRVVLDDGSRTQEFPATADATVAWLSGPQTAQHPKLLGYNRAGVVIGTADVLNSRQQRYIDCNFSC